MKKSFKVTSISIGVLGTIASVTGCASSTVSGANAAQSSPSKTVQSSVKGDASVSPVTVSFWYGVGGALSNDIQQLVAQYNKTHPSVHVVATYEGSYSGGGEEQQKLLAAIKAGTPPAIAQIATDGISVFADSGKLMNLTPLMKNSSVDKPNNFLNGMLVSTEFNGKYYAVPFNRSVPVLYYNKTQFKKAGISAAPTTWAQLMADAKKLTHGSGQSKTYGYGMLVDEWPWEYAVQSSGGSILSPNMKTAMFGKPQALGILSDESQLVKQGYAKVETGPNYWTLTTEDFIHGTTAMDIDSIGDAAQVTTGVGKSFEWGTALLPRGKTLAVPAGGGDMTMLNGLSPQVQKAAWNFIEWWTSPAQETKWSMETGYLPVENAVVHSKTYQAFIKQHPQYSTAINELKYQRPQPPTPDFMAVVGLVQNALEGIYDEGKPVNSTMQQAASQAQSYLQ